MGTVDEGEMGKWGDADFSFWIWRKIGLRSTCAVWDRGRGSNAGYEYPGMGSFRFGKFFFRVDRRTLRTGTNRWKYLWVRWTRMSMGCVKRRNMLLVFFLSCITPNAQS